MRIMNSRRAPRWALGAVCLAFVISQTAPQALAQKAPAGNLPTLSRFELPSQWVGGEPMTIDSLRGKAVFLYFYEESCPKCKGKWPKLMEVAAAHADEPIVFLAVSSGTSPQDVATYARSVQLDWPVLVDTDRSFERLCDVGEISLQNVMQVAYIKADGQMTRGRWNDIEGTIQTALKGAKWNLDPKEIPPELKKAWHSLEFSQYADAAPALNKALKSTKPPIKEAAEKLAATVNEKIAQELEVAAKSASQNRKNEAYEKYGAIAEQFAGFPAAEPATLRRKEIAKDPAFKKELVGLKQLEKQRALLDSPKETVRERARAAIQKLIDAQPESAVADQGRKLLGPPGGEEPAKRDSEKREGAKRDAAKP